ncbi:uncharacterized protein LOC129591475 [Paramacrobiotus metropolitanus]|uniref:uncharacterized protein LOC129591475 n=1 Tax=Paramacrobiotus metropolitanus TaxID=2943436 RepID=UPI002445975D|nr:uncharacterized protein LOC129591475 [Paramacrobiotus metropolitanus]XP_055343118.1 uncharacterized protein LOC129591475 [Paramacrobiotus metropolitanus]
MARGKTMDPDLVKAVFRLYRQENSTSKVDKTFGRACGWTYKILQKYDEETGEIKGGPKPKGRPRKTTAEQDREALAYVAHHPELSAAKAASTVQMHTRTLLRRMQEYSGQKKKGSKARRKSAGQRTLPTMAPETIN